MVHNEITKNELSKYEQLLKREKFNEWGEKIALFTFQAWDYLFDSAWYSIFDAYNTIEEYLEEQFNVTKDQIVDWRNYYLE